MAVKQNRKRYIPFRIISDREIQFETAKRAILESSFVLLGELGASKANINVLPEFWRNNSGVISVNHNYVQKLKFSLALIKQIHTQRIVVYTQKVYGTLKKIKTMFNKEVV